MNKKQEYVFDAWNSFLQDDSSAVILSDSLGNDLTRQEADELSGKVYAWLKANEVGKEDFVLVNLDRGVKPIVAVMGVLKAGAAFSLTESDYAPERIAFIKKDCGAKFEINEENWSDIMATESLAGFEYADDHDACFAVYTSGTTGTPKGVLHEYGQLILEMLSEQNEDGTWRENESTRWSLVAPLNFVASLKIIAHFLYCGGHLYIMDYDTVKNSKKLAAYFLSNKINETFLSPSLIRIKGKGFGPYMKFVYTGAEPANNIFVDNLELNNCYTMSESFFTVSEFIIDKPYPICPIGKPKFELDIKLIGEDGKEVEEGEVGELIYFNPYCRGYLNNEEENNKHFIDGYFHTGDLAEYRDGYYVLKGRADDMVKINGNRIEPAEIEAVGRSVLGLKNCVAKGFAKQGVVVLYYVDDVEIDRKVAKERLDEYLPYYMIPSYFIKMDKIPISASGKIDRKKLLLPLSYHKSPYVAPRDKVEEIVAQAYEKVLGVKKIGIDDDFFDLGGDSIKTIEVIDYIEERIKDNTITARLIFEGRSIRGIMSKKAEVDDELSPEEKEKYARDQKNVLRHFSALIYPVLKMFPEATTYNINTGIRIKKRFFFSPKRFVKAINSTIQNNSQMQSVVREEDGVLYWEYAPKCYPDIQLEHMSDSEALEVANTFVKGFGDCMDQKMYRIRVIESRKYLYIYSDFSHVLINGFGLSLFANDIIAAYFGKVNTDNRFYEWLYDLNKTVDSDAYKEANEYFTKKYMPYLDNMHFVNLGIESDVYIKKMYNIKFDVKNFEDHKKTYSVTNSVFINTVILTALSIINNQNEQGVLWCYNGIDGRNNHCGFASHCIPVALIDGEYSTLTDLYSDIKSQVEEGLRRGYFYFDYDSDFAKATKFTNVNIDYLADLESEDKFVKIGGEKIELKSPHDTDIPAGHIIAQLMDASDGFGLRLWHPEKELSEENAEKFVEIIQSVADTMLSGNLPKIPKKKA